MVINAGWAGMKMGDVGIGSELVPKVEGPHARPFHGKGKWTKISQTLFINHILIFQRGITSTYKQKKNPKTILNHLNITAIEIKTS